MKKILMTYKVCLSTLLFFAFNSQLIGQKRLECPNESCLETLHFDSVRLNLKIPLMLKDEDLIEFLGEPDSIVVENGWECGNYINSEYKVRILYYGKTKFMSSNGTSLLYILNLEENRFTFDFGNQQLKFGSSKSDLNRLFPNAVYSFNNKLKSYNEEGRMKVIMQQTPEFGDSSGWIFTFTGELIKEIELWWFIC